METQTPPWTASTSASSSLLPLARYADLAQRGLHRVHWKLFVRVVAE
jgi:hypothetical protein